MQELDEIPLVALQDDVLDELGDEAVGDIARLLGTDEAGARQVICTTVTAVSGEAEMVAIPPRAPLTGVPTVGGPATGGLMARLLAEEADPLTTDVAARTGLPRPAMARTVGVLVPAVLTVLERRATGR
ncbi:hypothetical protein [Streptomyces sp. NPDC056628]|uniref:hypothetical protein n=1 Tax=Streptomyces sp. NPDC056628 TaxID=3345882 RepID=UPI0036890F14